MWKAEIDYCKQIEMPETKDGGGAGVEGICMCLWMSESV